jgi:ketosteroid isomerase-like protein
MSCIAASLLLFAVAAGATQPANAMHRGERHESRHEIDQMELSWRDALVHRNAAAMDSLLSEDYIAITANGTLQTKDQALANLRTGAVHLASIEFSDRKVRFYGQTALVTSRAEVSGTGGNGDISGSYRYTRVYVRDDKGGWKIVSFEASRIRESGERK